MISISMGNQFIKRYKILSEVRKQSNANYSVGNFINSQVIDTKELKIQQNLLRTRSYEEIPGPKNLFQLMRKIQETLPGGKFHKKSVAEMNRLLREEYGDIIRFPGVLRRKDVIFIFDPQDFETVFRTEGICPTRNGLETFTYFRKHIRPDIFSQTGGLITEQGKKWGDFRSKVNPMMLQPKVVKQYTKPIDNITMDLVERICEIRDNKNEVPSDFDVTLQKWGLESVAIIALNIRLGLLNDSVNNLNGKIIASSVRNFFEYSFQLEILPSIWKFIPTPLFKKQMKNLNNLNEIIMKYISIAVENIERNSTNQCVDHELSVFEKLLKIDRNVALVMATDMFLAGSDTISSFSTSILYALAKNPAVQEKLRQEILQILPEKDTPITVNKFKSLPYLRACVKETNRMFPVTNGHFRATGQDLILKGYQIPKGTDIAMGVSNSYNDESIYPNCKQFIPERWLKNVECPSAQIPHPFDFLPFGFGPRMCIGRRFAELITEILVLRLVRNFQIEWHYNDLKYIGKYVNVPVGDIKFRFIDVNVSNKYRKL